MSILLLTSSIFCLFTFLPWTNFYSANLVPCYSINAYLWVLFCTSVHRSIFPHFLQNLSSPLRSLSKWSWLGESVTPGAPVDTARNRWNHLWLVSLLSEVHILCILWSHLYFSASLRRIPQNQSPRLVAATLCPRERRHSLVVWLQVHKQPTLLWRHAQAGLHRVCPTTWANRLLKRTER